MTDREMQTSFLTMSSKKKSANQLTPIEYSCQSKYLDSMVWYGIILFDKQSKVHGEIMSFAINIWLHVGRLHIEYVEFSLLCSHHRLYN